MIFERKLFELDFYVVKIDELSIELLVLARIVPQCPPGVLPGDPKPTHA